MTNDVAVVLCAILFVGSLVTMLLDIIFLKRVIAKATVGPADISIGIGADDATEARKAVASSGLSGADADALFAGIMEGIKRAKASGRDHDIIAINMDRPVALSRVMSQRGTRLVRHDPDGDDDLVS